MEFLSPKCWSKGTEIFQAKVMIIQQYIPTVGTEAITPAQSKGDITAGALQAHLYRHLKKSYNSFTRVNTKLW